MTDQLRDRIAAAIVADLKKAIPPLRAYPGDPGIGGMGRTEFDVADAVLAVVQPELDRLQAEVEQINEALRKAGIEYPLGAAGVRDLAAHANGAREDLDAAPLRAVDIYPVGLLADLKQWANNPDRRGAWRRLRYDVRTHGLRHLRNCNWQVLRRWLTNGYLAEPAEWPDGLTRCGTGWTRGRALRDLQQRAEALAVARAQLGGVTE